MKKIFLAMAIAIVTGTAVSAQDDDKEDKIVVSTHQTDKEDGYEGHSASRCGIKFNFQLIGVTKVELESVAFRLQARRLPKRPPREKLQSMIWYIQVPL